MRPHEHRHHRLGLPKRFAFHIPFGSVVLWCEILGVKQLNPHDTLICRSNSLLRVIVMSSLTNLDSAVQDWIHPRRIVPFRIGYPAQLRFRFAHCALIQISKLLDALISCLRWWMETSSSQEGSAPAGRYWQGASVFIGPGLPGAPIRRLV